MGKHLLGMLMVGCLAAGCASPYKADYDPEHDFSSYRSYAWLEPNETPMSVAGNPLLKRRLVSAVDRVFQERGYGIVDSNDADFHVHTHGTVEERMRVHEGLYSGYGYYGRYSPMAVRHMDVRYYDEGTLFIDVIDRVKGELVWRGWVTQPVHNYRDPRQAERAVERSVRGMLANFPPSPIR